VGEEIYVMQECAECRKSTSGKCARHLQSGKIDDRYFDIRLNNKTLSALRRYMTASMYETRANDIISAEQFGADNIDICAWLDGEATCG